MHSDSIFVSDHNWLSLILISLAFPLMEIADLVCGVMPSISVSMALIIEFFCLQLVLNGATRHVFRPASDFNKIIPVWIIFSCILIIYFTVYFRRTTSIIAPLYIFGPEIIIAASLFFAIKQTIKGFPKVSSMLAGFASLLIGWYAIHSMLALTIPTLPYVYDPVLYRFQYILHLENAKPFISLMNVQGPIPSIINAFYVYLDIGIILAAISENLYADGNARSSLILRFLVAGFIGYILYYFMPAVDPRDFFQSTFPNQLPSPNDVAWGPVVPPQPARDHTPRNTMPSLHATWALLVFLALRDSPKIQKLLGGAFVLITLIATLGIGVHYTVDWFAAVPLVLLTRALCASTLSLQNPSRRSSLIVGVGLILAWVFAVRTPSISLAYPILVQALAIFSIVLPFFLERRLARSESNYSDCKRLADSSLSDPTLVGQIPSSNPASYP